MKNPLLFAKEGKDFYSTDMEVFAVGTWNKDTYTTKDLDQMVEAFAELRDKWKPTIKLGHGKQLAEQPALGYVDTLKRVGKKLIARVTGIPKLVKQAMEKGLFKKRSAEIYWNYKEENKTWPRVLKAVALLGASIPAVSTLKDIEKFFDEGTGEIKTYETEFSFDVAGGEVKVNLKGVIEKVLWDDGSKTIIAKLRPVENFDYSHSVTLSESKVSYVVGRLKDEPENQGGDIVQAWQFSKDDGWTLEKAQEWLSSLQEYQRVTKTEGGVQYPKEAYLYVPDPGKPTTWKLRVWESLEKKVTREQLGRAAAAFSPGGFRGQEVSLPSDQIPKMKSKLKSLYKGIGVADGDIPVQLERKENTDMNELEQLKKQLEEKQKAIDELTKQIEKFKKDPDKVKELTESLRVKEEEVTTLKAFKEKAEKATERAETAERALEEVAQKRHEDGIKAFVKEQGAEGKKHILPRDVELVTTILKSCPTEKKFKHGDKEMTLFDMVKEFVSNLPDLLKLEQLSKKDADDTAGHKKASDEVHEKATKYQKEHSGVSYFDSIKAVLKEDEDLKKRYDEERK